MRPEKGNKEGLEPFEKKVKEYVEKYEGTTINERVYNKDLKIIAQMAKINREIEVISTNGEKQIKKAFEIITSHCARHTDITNRLKEGLTAEEVAEHTGHKTTKYINNTYSHLTIEDLIKKDKERRAAAEQITPKTDDNKIYEYRDVLAFYGCARKDYEHIKDSEELLRMIVTKYEMELEKEGLNHTLLKKIYNGEYENFEDRKHLERLLETINTINQIKR